jgi:hypothetical protein
MPRATNLLRGSSRRAGNPPRQYPAVSTWIGTICGTSGTLRAAQRLEAYMIRNTSRPILLIALCLATVSCAKKSAPPAAVTKPTTPAGDAQWTAFANRFIEDYFELEPFFAVNAGRHEFDGKMPDLSAGGIQHKITWLKRVRAQADTFDAAKLIPEQRLERENVLAAIDTELFWVDRARFPFVNPAWYIDRLDPDVYLSRNYAPLERRLVGYIGYARAIPGISTAIRTNLQTPLPKSFIERGIDAFGGYADFYRNDVPKVFAEAKDEQARKRLAQANEAAAKAMAELKSWLESERSKATDNFALGYGMFAEMLKQTEQVDTPLEELSKAGREDLERNLKALREACSAYLPRAPLRVCIDTMNSKKPEGGAVPGARTQLADLKKFVVDKRLVSIPSADEALVKEAPPYNRGNFAYINVPGPYEETPVYVYYVAPPDPSWTPAERAAYIPGKADLLFTSIHEVWPGHFLQFLHANRNPSKIAALWVGYAYAEGWAHYSEEMMSEAGLGDGNPETHIGQITNALLRNVRFISAIGLHTKGMTLKQSEQLFRDSAFQDPGNARQQAARGTYDPAYLNYTLGKLMIRKLRADWIAKQPPAADPRQYWRGFHDRFLSYASSSVPLVRKHMLGEGGSLF